MTVPTDGRAAGAAATAAPDDAFSLMDAVRARHPRFASAVAADARAVPRAERGDHRDRGRWKALPLAARLTWSHDGFPGLVAYRAKARLEAVGRPGLAPLAHRLAMLTSQVSIGSPVNVDAGIDLPSGNVVIDGAVEIGRGAVIGPHVTIGLREGDGQGAVIGDGVTIEAGAKLIGPIHVGAGAHIEANAVVVDDVPPGGRVAGVPARLVG